jgi:hypothetical protein
MTAMPQANAEIEFHPSGRGDTLLFPVFNGYIENYFTIMNNHDEWIQGHLRFRGAAWSGELRDFDIILSPGDVFVFRIADIDGDGWWEIDQSLDIRNFQYTGLGGTPKNQGMDDFKVNTCGPWNNLEGPRYPKCMDPSDHLIPSATALADKMRVNGSKDPEFLKQIEGIIEYHKNMGYVEFIGEAVLDGLDYNIMEILLGENPGNWARYQTKVFSRHGTNAWAWSDAAEQYATDRRQVTTTVISGLSDVPNALSGTAFLTIPGVGHGLAYNAEALVDFRTVATDHRIDNYRVKCPKPGQMPGAECVLLDGINTPETLANRAVIVHDENAAGSSVAVPRIPFGDYVYQCTPEDRFDEERISFNNTWGPTLADGDDYDLYGFRNTGFEAIAPTESNKAFDDFDHRNVGEHGLGGGVLRPVNSVAEVEEAIRIGIAKHPPTDAGPQVFTAYYMDGDIFDKSCEGNGTRRNTGFCPQPIPPGQSRAKPPAGATTLTTLTSYYLAFFPTKFYYGENAAWLEVRGCDGYMLEAIARLLSLRKPAGMEVWDNFEKSGRCGPTVIMDESVSPAVPIQVRGQSCDFGFELTFLSINDVKNLIGADSVVQDFVAGRVVMDIPWEYNYPYYMDPDLTFADQELASANYEQTWPGLMYTFEWDGGPTLAHFRPMHRMLR